MGLEGVGGAWPEVDASLISSLATTRERGGLGYMVMSEGNWFFNRLPIMWLHMHVRFHVLAEGIQEDRGGQASKCCADLLEIKISESAQGRPPA